MTVDLIAAGTLRVVIVDDTADLRELLRFALVRGGMTVVGEAGDGLAGIEVVRTTQPDVVLLDLSMPVMDGLEALPQIRASAPDAKVIVLSGFEAAQMAERAMTIGADGYLQKGSSLGRILDQIRDIVGRPDQVVTGAAPGEVRLPPVAVVPGLPQPQRDAVSLAPFGIVEVAAETPYRLVSCNAAASSLLRVDPTPGEPLADVAPELAAAIANSRLAGDGDLEATVHSRPVRVVLRHTATTLLLYLHESTDEVGRLRNAIATTAHELRGPVAVLCAITETILEEDLEAQHVDRLLTAIGRQSRLLDTLTGDLLVGAQVQRGTLRLETRELDPVAVVTEVMQDHQLDLDDLEVEDHRMVLADPLRLHQMLGNLVSNAHKYGEPPVRMRVRPSSEHDCLVAIDVEDHGPGVPPEFRAHLFHEFTRAVGTAAPGTGLGLHVVRTLAQGQGGSVSYEPRPGTGSVFTINLPAASR